MIEEMNEICGDGELSANFIAPPTLDLQGRDVIKLQMLGWLFGILGMCGIGKMNAMKCVNNEYDGFPFAIVIITNCMKGRSYTCSLYPEDRAIPSLKRIACWNTFEMELMSMEDE
ncbi:hypothetical protein SLE2022_381940 [Rubroshorea leprosula]